MFQAKLASLREKPVFLAAVLVLVPIVLYAPTSHHDFLTVDDSAYVTNNIHVTSGLRISNVIWALTDYSTFYWHPVTWISHMIDCQLFGLSSGAHHTVNLLLHVVNVLLLFFLLQSATGAVWRSFLVAALFAVHPMNVETVAWVAERKSLLSALFSLLTVAAYGSYVRRRGWKRYVLVTVMFLLALASKSMAVTIPVVLLLLDYWPLRRDEEVATVCRWKGLLLEKLPLFAMSLLSAAITVIGQRISAVVSLSELPFYMRLENALIAYVAYLERLFWPAHLAFFYPHPASKVLKGGHLPTGQLIVCSAILLGITLIVLRFRRVRYLVTGWFSFLIVLFPVSGVVQSGLQAMADRFSYLPFIGLFIIVIWSIGDIAESFSTLRVQAALAAVSACVLLAYASAGSRYLTCWQNSVTLMEHTRAVAGAPDAMIEEFLGDAYYFSGQPARSVPHYRMWCTLVPAYDLCHYNLAQVLFQQGELREALSEYQMAGSLTRNPDIAAACANKSRQVLSMLREQ